MTIVYECRVCGEAAFARVCDDCVRVPKKEIKRRKQPSDPAVYVPDFDGLRGLDERK